jgi:hypothetical protein
MKRLHRQQQGETRLDTATERDLWEAFHRLPYIQVSRSAFIGMVLECPPEIKLKSFPLAQSEEMQMLLKLYWLPWLQNMYIWIKIFGICPWYVKRLRGTPHSIPVVPPFGSGYMTTHMDAKTHEQVFHWYWTNTTEPEPNMFFEFGPSALQKPTLAGEFTSAMSALLDEYRTIKIVRQATEIATYHQARPQHIFEFHPPRNNPGDDNLVNLEAFGEKIAGSVQRQQEALRGAKMTLRADQLYDSVLRASAANKGVQLKFGASPIMQSEERGQQWERENAGMIDRGIPLRPDFHYKTAAQPKLGISLDAIAKRLDMLSGSVMDFPIQLIQAAGTKTSANVSGLLRFVNERIKDWITYFEMATKRAYLLLYGKVIQEGLDQVVRARRRKLGPVQMIELYASTELEVHMPCTPLASYDQLKQMWMDALWKKKTFAKHAANLYGVSDSDLAVTEEPDMMPGTEREQEPKKRRKKGQEPVEAATVE